MGIQISLPMMAFLVFMTGFAGFIDSAAGGGGLISLPAYLFAGLPPHYTYATNKFSAACGTTFATASFFKNGAMNIKVGILAAIGSFAGSALGAHIVLMLSDEVLQMMMFIILPIAAVVILWRRNLPDENRDDGTLNLKKALLALGIGDTLRVSLSADPVEEVYAAKDILKALGMAANEPNLVSCPTCGRTRIDLIGLANQVEERLKNVHKPITVAVMGCVVNGPGEAREADIGIAGGKGEAVLFVHGEPVRKLTGDNILDQFMEEIYKL